MFKVFTQAVITMMVALRRHSPNSGSWKNMEIRKRVYLMKIHSFKNSLRRPIPETAAATDDMQFSYLSSIWFQSWVILEMQHYSVSFELKTLVLALRRQERLCKIYARLNPIRIHETCTSWRSWKITSSMVLHASSGGCKRIQHLDQSPHCLW